METRPEEQEHIDDNHSETEHEEEEESEYIDYYHGSAGETHGMSADDEDDHDDFLFENVPYYFRPTYTDTAHEEDTAPRHFMYSREQHPGTENKEAVDNMDDYPGLEEPNSMEKQPWKQEFKGNAFNHEEAKNK